MFDVHDADGATISPRAWIRWVLALVVLACLVVGTANAIVDPTAQLGTNVIEPIASGPRDREAKVELLAAAGDPDIVVLGSSRSKKLDPLWVEPEATRPINAAVVGGDIFEGRVITALLAAQVKREGADFPRLLVGIDIEQFRDSSLHGSGFLSVPAAERVARREASGSAGSLGDELQRYGRLLLSWQVTKASIASVRARQAGKEHPRADAETLDVDEFTDRGMPAEDARWWKNGASRGRAAELAASLPERIEESIRTYQGTYDRVGAELDPDAVADLRALVGYVRDNGGPPPVLYLTPAHPQFAEEFEDDGRPERRQAVLELLTELAVDGDAIVLDCSECIERAPRYWIDAVHPSPLGAKQLAVRIAKRLDEAKLELT